MRRGAIHVSILRVGAIKANGVLVPTRANMLLRQIPCLHAVGQWPHRTRGSAGMSACEAAQRDAC